MPLGSCGQTSTQFWYYGPLSACSQILDKKVGVPGKTWTRKEVRVLKDLTEKSVIFSAQTTFHGQLLLSLEQLKTDVRRPRNVSSRVKLVSQLTFSI